MSILPSSHQSKPSQNCLSKQRATLGPHVRETELRRPRPNERDGATAGRQAEMRAGWDTAHTPASCVSLHSSRDERPASGLLACPQPAMPTQPLPAHQPRLASPACPAEHHSPAHITARVEYDNLLQCAAVQNRLAKGQPSSVEPARRGRPNAPQLCVSAPLHKSVCGLTSKGLAVVCVCVRLIHPEPGLGRVGRHMQLLRL